MTKKLGGLEGSNPTEAPNTLILRSKSKATPKSRSTLESPIIVCPGGDLILHYVSSASAETHYWKVDRETLRKQSSYFNVLLDPTRSFMENNSLASQLANLSTSDALPVVKLPTNAISDLYGMEAFELFLQMCCLESLKTGTAQDGEDSLMAVFFRNLHSRPPSLIARLIAIAGFYQNEERVCQVLRNLNYLGRNKSQEKFSQETLRLGEDRIRQCIFIARALKEHTILRRLSHALVVLGSKHWAQPPENPGIPHLPWQYLADGLEWQLFYRRQCVLNTIADLQAYFLRKFGGLDTEQQNPTTASSGAARNLLNNQERAVQCRAGLDNANQCDLFHLGQMTRFFSVRTKSVFIGSNYIDPDFRPPSTSDETVSTPHHVPPVPDIASILVALKKCPDYQIDQNHNACGIRRRLLPILDCIEKFVMDGYGLLGVQADEFDTSRNSIGPSWAEGYTRAVHITFGQISLVEYEPGHHHKRVYPFSHVSGGSLSKECRAHALFTAQKCVWEPESRNPVTSQELFHP
ncbi:hypothetical protein N7539_002889 [Penicillium diatomitis]|uniref:BTB domain-containing protein n=1 Tax=Penicillium diatomitis TaxID=2819901 RepID=A0A9X0BZM1_9EURO|nr:uncharacterized protein N7539_002889 [Penicillium diatomitis]KAJ5491322.1 hypothetical protein N7539_002889 [Penicillium diatomitis]